MKKLGHYWLIFTSLCFLVMPCASQDVNDIVQKIDEVLYSAKDQKSLVKVINVDKNGKEKTQKAQVYQKGNNKRLFRFFEPASQKGVTFLSLPNDIMYIYMPAFGKERRIAAHVKNQNFAGMTFTYEDLESKLLTEKYNAKLLQTDNEYYYIEFIPKPEQNSEYSKVIMKVNKKDYYPVIVDYYDKAAKKIKTSEYTFNRKGKYWSPTIIKMTDLRKNQTTSMILEAIDYDTGLSDDEFTVRKLVQ